MLAKAGKLSSREKLIQKLEELTARDLKNMTPYNPLPEDYGAESPVLYIPHPFQLEIRRREAAAKAKQAKQEPATPPAQPEQAPPKPKPIPLLRRGVSPQVPVPKPPEPVDPIAKLQELVKLAQCGDNDALNAIRRELDANPAIWQNVGNLAAHAEQLLIGIIADGNPMVSESIEREIARLKVEMTGDNPSPLERLTIQRVVACWLHAQYVDRAILIADASGAKVAAWGKRQEAAQRCYYAAIKSLELVRRLTPPKQTPPKPENIKPVRQRSEPIKNDAAPSPAAIQASCKTSGQKIVPIVNGSTTGNTVPVNRFAERFRKVPELVN
jgi:hypothetical protein